MALWHLSQSENDNLAPHPCLKLEYPMSKAISIVSLQNSNYWHLWVGSSWDVFPAAVIWTGSVLVFLYNKQIFEILHIFLQSTEYHFCLVLVLCKQHIVRWICFLWFELGLSWSPVITPGREKTYIFNVVNIEASDKIRWGQNRSAPLFSIFHLKVKFPNEKEKIMLPVFYSLNSIWGSFESMWLLASIRIMGDERHYITGLSLVFWGSGPL